MPCVIASEIHMHQECMDEVDGFIFHPPTTAHRPYVPIVKHPYQQWILFSTESELNYPILNGATQKAFYGRGRRTSLTFVLRM